ncbi:MAG: protein kinase [Myxococcota bacterium]|nr:protein kinase [Myxococcota bacterium]
MTDQGVKTDNNGIASTEPNAVPGTQDSKNIDETTSSKLPTDSQAVADPDLTERVSARTISESLKRKRAKSNLTDIDASNATIPLDLDAVSSTRERDAAPNIGESTAADETAHQSPAWAEGLIEKQPYPTELQTVDDRLPESVVASASDQIDVSSLPQSTQSLIANVEMETPNESRSTNDSQPNLRPLLGSFILLGGYGELRDGLYEFEHVLEVRKIAAPRRGLLRRGLFVERDEDYSHLFLAEAEVARQIVHPNVTRVYHVGRHNSFPYLVREHVPGITLAEHIISHPRAKIEFSQFAAIFVQVIDGLHAIHELRNASGESLQMVHAAINPNSVLLGRTGRVRITEPISSAYNGRVLDSSQLTRHQIEDYQAPELQDTPKVSAMWDWYSLAITMVEFLGSASAAKAVNTNPSVESVKSNLFSLSLMSQHDQLFECLCGLLTEPPERRVEWALQLRAIFQEGLKGSKAHHVVAGMLKKDISEVGVESAQDVTQSMKVASDSESIEAKQAITDELPYRRKTTEVAQISQNVETKSKLILPVYLMIALGLVGALMGMFLLNWFGD